MEDIKKLERKINMSAIRRAAGMQNQPWTKSQEFADEEKLDKRSR